MTIQTLSRFMGVFVMLCMFGCGGGGGEAPGSLNPTVTILVKTSGVAGPLYGVQFKVNLPAGVTLGTAANGDVADGVVKTYGSATGSNLVSNYVASTTPQTLAVSVTSSPSGSGFQVGEFLEIACTVASGAVIPVSSQVISDFIAYDKPDINQGGNPISGVTGSWLVK